MAPEADKVGSEVVVDPGRLAAEQATHGTSGQGGQGDRRGGLIHSFTWYA